MLRSWRGSLYALIAIGCGVSATSAQPPGGPLRGERGPGGPPDADAIFRRIDANGDGSISRREFARAHEELMNRLRDGFHRAPPFAYRREGDSRGPKPSFDRSRFADDHPRPPFRGPRPGWNDDRRGFQHPSRDDDDDRRPPMTRDRDDDNRRGPPPPFSNRRHDDDRRSSARDNDDRGPHRPAMFDHVRRPGTGGPPDRMRRGDDDDDDRPGRDRDDD